MGVPPSMRVTQHTGHGVQGEEREMPLGGNSQSQSEEKLLVFPGSAAPWPRGHLRSLGTVVNELIKHGRDYYSFFTSISNS